MPALIQTIAQNGGDSVKLYVREDYDTAVERLAAGGLAAFALDRDGSRVAVNPAQVAFVREHS